MGKYCPKCKKIKNREEFYTNKGRGDGLASYCKICNNKYSLQKYNQIIFDKICPICKREFKGLKHKTYCSSKCKGRLIKKPISGHKNCIICNKKFPYRETLRVRSSNGIASINQKFCSKKCVIKFLTKFNKEHPPSQEQRILTAKKISERFKGKKKSISHRLKMSSANKGSKSHFWKDGRTEKNRIIRESVEYSIWREKVFKRDNFTCQKYKERGGKLCPHHIQNFAQCPELRFIVDNGITLLDKAHQEFHKKYGVKNNTREQLEEFLEQKEFPVCAKKLELPKNYSE